FILFSFYVIHRALLSFPTRRSSDLGGVLVEPVVLGGAADAAQLDGGRVVLVGDERALGGGRHDLAVVRRLDDGLLGGRDAGDGADDDADGDEGHVDRGEGGVEAVGGGHDCTAL